MFGHVRIAVIVRLRVIYFRYSECKGSNNICIPPLVERGLILQSPCPSVCSSIHTFVKDVSAATERNDFIFDT